MTRPKLMFVATEDWFVRSHFLPMVRRAVADGFDTIVAARMGDAQADLVAAGARLIDLSDARGLYGVAAMAKSVHRLHAALQRERPDIVHAIALRPILLACLATLGAKRPALVLAVTGRGYLAMTSSWRAKRALDLVALLIAQRVRAGRAVLLVENDDDRAWVAGQGALPADRVVLAPGAGVELDRYTPAPEPAPPPIRVGFVSRLVRSKGADLAVESIQRLRREGLDVTLTIAGAPDFENPAAVAPETLAAWSALPGVEVIGPITDVAGFWASKHMCCLPSRGGEGLPRSILEAGACARPIVTTAVPGCQDFVVHGLVGLVASPNDADSLSKAIRTLATDAALRNRLGDAARARVANGYTVRDAADRAAQAWGRARERGL